MTRRLLILLLAAAALLPGCREERPARKLSESEAALLAEKADARIEAIVRQNLPGTFAGLVAFRSDAFLYHSAMLEQAEIPVLNVFGKAAILRLRSGDVGPLLAVPAVRKVRHLGPPALLVRFDPAFEMELLRRYGNSTEQDNVGLRVRFREPPVEADERFVADAGFAVLGRAGAALLLAGPLDRLPRLMEHEGIAQYGLAAPSPPAR